LHDKGGISVGVWEKGTPLACKKGGWKGTVSDTARKGGDSKKKTRKGSRIKKKGKGAGDPKKKTLAFRQHAK